MQVDGPVLKGDASIVRLKDSGARFRANAVRRLTSQPGPVSRTFASHQKTVLLAISTSPRHLVGPLLYKDLRRPRPRVSAVGAGVVSPTQGQDKDLHKKCLQAAVHLQERGWAVVEDVLTW